MDKLFNVYFNNLGIIITTWFGIMLALQENSKCPTSLCVCKPRYTANCINHGKGLDYIPKLPVTVKKLVFVNNFLQDVNRATFANLTLNTIKNLNLSSNRIQHISNDAFMDFKYMYILDLSGNNNINISTLQQSFKSLNFLPSGALYLQNIFRTGEIPSHFFKELTMGYLQNIYLGRNNLIRVYGDSFRHLSYLNKLDLSNNSLVSIDLHGLHTLTSLQLDYNNLHRIPKLCFKNGTSLVGHLRFFSITNNRVRYLKTSDFICVPRIRFLYLVDNPLSTIQNNAFAPLRKLQKLHIKVPNEKLRHLGSYAFNASNLRQLSLSGANFKFKRGSFDPDNIFSHCPWLKTLVLSNNRVPSDSETPIRMFGKLKKLMKLILQNVGWRVIPGDLFNRLPCLKALDLGNNNIFSLSLNNPFENVKGLISLGLGGNRINSLSSISTFLPKNILSSLKTLNLARNPYVCSCDLIWFVKWLNKTDIGMQEYPRDYICKMPLPWKGKHLNTYTADCIVHSKISLKIILILSGSALVIILVMVVIVYKIRWHIRYWIYLIRAKKRQYVKLQDLEYLYEGFVVYCDSDRKWVHENLVPCLEEEHGYKLCIHYRDFQVGKLIVDNIVESMEQSRRIILVLSNAFAKSEWCQFEVLLAHKRFMENGNDDLIIVLLEELNSRYFTNALKVILTSTTYAIWSEDDIGQNLFWNQILTAFDIVHRPIYDQLNA